MHPGGSRTATARGQTGLDYLVGIGVFLLTVGFVLAFVPGTLTPFTDDTAHPLVADRAADTVVAGLADGPEPGALTTTCTVAFFVPGADDTGCRFDTADTTDPDALPGELGLPTFTRVNVTLERSVAGTSGWERQCWTGTSIDTCSPTADRLAVGRPVPATEPVVTATRAVYVDGADAVVVVRVW